MGSMIQCITNPTLCNYYLRKFTTGSFLNINVLSYFPKLDRSRLPLSCLDLFQVHVGRALSLPSYRE